MFTSRSMRSGRYSSIISSPNGAVPRMQDPEAGQIKILSENFVSGFVVVCYENAVSSHCMIACCFFINISFNISLISRSITGVISVL